MSESTCLLGDTPARDYSAKLSLFNAFAEPELRRVIEELRLRPGMRVLDAGCGTGEALGWLLDAVQPSGSVLGIDLSRAHIAAAQRRHSSGARAIQGDLLDVALDPGRFDLVWCMNTINHLKDPVAGVRRLAAAVNPGGRVVLAQSSFLPDMVFAWDARLERLVNEAVRAYYRDRYSLTERDLSKIRRLVGIARQADLRCVQARTHVIERLAPLEAAAERYLLEGVFRGTWGSRLRPYLSEDDYADLSRACDPDDGQFALRRPDFHYLQTFSLVVGEV